MLNTTPSTKFSTKFFQLLKLGAYHQPKTLVLDIQPNFTFLKQICDSKLKLIIDYKFWGKTTWCYTWYLATDYLKNVGFHCWSVWDQLLGYEKTWCLGTKFWGNKKPGAELGIWLQMSLRKYIFTWCCVWHKGLGFEKTWCLGTKFCVKKLGATWC